MFEIIEKDGERTLKFENGEVRTLASDRVAAALVDEIEEQLQ